MSISIKGIFNKEYYDNIARAIIEKNPKTATTLRPSEMAAAIRNITPFDIVDLTSEFKTLFLGYQDSSRCFIPINYTSSGYVKGTEENGVESTEENGVLSFIAKCANYISKNKTVYIKTELIATREVDGQVVFEPQSGDTIAFLINGISPIYNTNGEIQDGISFVSSLYERDCMKVFFESDVFNNSNESKVKPVIKEDNSLNYFWNNILNSTLDDKQPTNGGEN